MLPSFCAHQHPARWVLSPPILSWGGSEAQRGKGTCPRPHWPWGLNGHRRKDSPDTPIPGFWGPRAPPPLEAELGAGGVQRAFSSGKGNASPGRANNRCAKQAEVGDDQKRGAAFQGGLPMEGLEQTLPTSVQMAGRGSEPGYPSRGVGRGPSAPKSAQWGWVVRGHLAPTLPGTKLSAAAFQGSKMQRGGQRGKALFSCLLLHLHKVKNVSIETTRVCNF